MLCTNHVGSPFWLARSFGCLFPTLESSQIRISKCSLCDARDPEGGWPCPLRLLSFIVWSIVSGLIPRLGAARSEVEALSEVQAMRGWLDAREAAVLAVAHSQCDDVNSGARDITQLCQQRANVSFAEGKRRAAKATWLPQLPAARAALAAGRLGSAQCDEICALAERLEPAQLGALTAAESRLVSELIELTPVQARKHLVLFEAEVQSADDGKTKLQRQQRDNSLRFTKRRDGTVGVSGQLDPISAAYVTNCIDNRVSEMWRREGIGRGDAHAPAKVMTNDRGRAEALVELLREAQTGGGSRAGLTEMLVLIDYQTLLGQLAEHGICEMDDGSPIPADSVRQMACDARIIPIVLAGPSVGLDVGRASRTATSGQRAALRATHDSCCVRGCDVSFRYCQIHHITWWRNRGDTDLANLAPVCSKHHHLIHDYAWTLTLDADRAGSLSRDHTGQSAPGTCDESVHASNTPRHAQADEPSRESSHQRPNSGPLRGEVLIPMRC